MTRCAECKWNYPDEYLDQMFIDGGYTKSICGICALELSNRITGIKRTKFQGEVAEAKRVDAVNWRKYHPKDKS